MRRGSTPLPSSLYHWCQWRTYLPSKQVLWVRVPGDALWHVGRSGRHLPVEQDSDGFDSHTCRTCASSPTGRGVGFRNRMLWVRVPPCVPYPRRWIGAEATNLGYVGSSPTGGTHPLSERHVPGKGTWKVSHWRSNCPAKAVTARPSASSTLVPSSIPPAGAARGFYPRSSGFDSSWGYSVVLVLVVARQSASLPGSVRVRRTALPRVSHKHCHDMTTPLIP